MIVTLDDPSEGKLNGIVREKVRFGQRVKDDGTVVHRAYSRYFVTLPTRTDSEALVDDEHIFRDRKLFSKQMLRSYLKNCLHREAWSGAPWQVKARLAEDFNINTQIPPHLQYEAQVIQRKIVLPKKGERNGSITDFFGRALRDLPELKPKGPKAKQTAQETDRIRQERLLEYQRTMERNPSLTQFPRNIAARKSDPQTLQFINQHPIASPKTPKTVIKEPPQPPPPPPPAPIKFPREDLENLISSTKRPTLRFLSDRFADMEASTTGLLLETWDTLNVYCEVFLLDSFTFDDFLDALNFSAEDGTQSELLVEIHCGILKKLVNSENDQNGKANIALPRMQGSEEDESKTQSKTATPTPEPEPERRTTRNSLRKSEAAEALAQAELDARVHLGAEIDQSVQGYGWKKRLAKRDFTNGRWIVILVGLLNLYSTIGQHQALCHSILSHLAPPQMKPTEDTAISQYSSLDINNRVKIIQFLCSLSISTQAIRDYMDDCTATMTQFRKEKIEWQRKRKVYLEELKNLDHERRELQPGAPPPAPEIQQLAEEVEDSEMRDGDETEDVEKTEEGGMDSDDDEPIPARSLRRAKDREADRKRRREEDMKRKKKAEAEKAKKPSKEAKRLDKVMKKIEIAKDNIKECEIEISICDNDLRENDCPRTRILGRDRFWNRYFWFERNAMPYGGLPDSSTAHAEYANGCLWVQGPDPLERAGFIDVSDAENAKYSQTFGFTLPERKLKEEGGSSLKDAFEWGYYDDPSDLDKLINWLSEKGNRENKLRKELQAQRERIATHMGKRKAYLGKDQRERSESAEPVTRVSTRKKTYLDTDSHRFLQWHNSTAMRQLGHIHSKPPLPKAQKKGLARPVNKRKQPEPVVEEEARQTRGSASKKTRTLGRQGTRYDF